MYRTTRKFLEYFGLKDLVDLPTLEDLQEELSGELENNAQEEMDFNTPSVQNTSLEGANEDSPQLVVPEKKTASSNEEEPVSSPSNHDVGGDV